MTNPFDDETGTFSVVVNTEGQHSLWPTFAEVPAGWTVAHGPGTRAECLSYVTENWQDMRPSSLIAKNG
jgi:MbtH protein